jgi:hypothetical protein
MLFFWADRILDLGDPQAAVREGVSLLGLSNPHAPASREVSDTACRLWLKRFHNDVADEGEYRRAVRACAGLLAKVMRVNCALFAPTGAARSPLDVVIRTMDVPAPALARFAGAGQGAGQDMIAQALGAQPRGRVA